MLLLQQIRLPQNIAIVDVSDQFLLELVAVTLVLTNQIVLLDARRVKEASEPLALQSIVILRLHDLRCDPIQCEFNCVVAIPVDQ